LSTFSDLPYDSSRAPNFPAISGVAFPASQAVLIRSPIPQIFVLSEAAFERLLTAFGGSVGARRDRHERDLTIFAIVSLHDIYDFPGRDQAPNAAGYLVGMTSQRAAAIRFRCFMMRRGFVRAAATLGSSCCCFTRSC